MVVKLRSQNGSGKNDFSSVKNPRWILFLRDPYPIGPHYFPAVFLTLFLGLLLQLESLISHLPSSCLRSSVFYPVIPLPHLPGECLGPAVQLIHSPCRRLVSTDILC